MTVEGSNVIDKVAVSTSVEIETVEKVDMLTSVNVLVKYSDAVETSVIYEVWTSVSLTVAVNNCVSVKLFVTDCVSVNDSSSVLICVIKEVKVAV